MENAENLLWNIGKQFGGKKTLLNDFLLMLLPFLFRYQFEQMFIHWGNGDDDKAGSEHSINGRHFPGEIQVSVSVSCLFSKNKLTVARNCLQFYGFNAELYSNLSEAVLHPYGAVGVAIMLQMVPGDRGSNPGLKPVTAQLKKVIYRGQSHPVMKLNLAELMPNTENYMTYEGSATYPGCWETVTWIVMNKPIYVSQMVNKIHRRFYHVTLFTFCISHLQFAGDGRAQAADAGGQD